MKTFPMFLALAGRRVVIAGGGEQAAQKARLMVRTEARIVLLAPELGAELAALVAAGRAEHDAAPASVASFIGAALVFVATGDRAADAALHAMATAAGALVNVVDRPELCDAFTPSLVDRDPVVVAIGTEGAAPVLARLIRARIEAMLEPRLGAFADLAGGLRGAVARRLPPEARRAFWAWAFAGAPRRLHAAGREREAAAALSAAIARGGVAAEAGGISFAPGLVADLLTLRAVQRLQEADAVFCDPGIDPGALELARRDAERAWPDAPGRAALAAARQGRQVVRLLAGAPAAAEVAAARAAGVAVELVPGVAEGAAREAAA